ncbi:LamG-like jellyroll fold domain-containing protein [Flavobacterium sp.]|uniref:LamG-like jellyroll fold domain-containing protein n=1 Tax=Flavobacterium sp. TaxID=239 RepID=UPI002B4AB4F9|nr:LamG-like jellyroll fold domain-containing protein [Flavobacterium sp.]HLF51899.1 LamG-like jellyroll fold domain-containing protein [Flavobacterium sp.]
MNTNTIFDKKSILLILTGLYVFPLIAIAQIDIMNQRFNCLSNTNWSSTPTSLRVQFDEVDYRSNAGTTTEEFNINLYGQNNPIAHNSMAIIANGTDFGSTQIVSDQITRTFTIKNIGSGTVNLTGTPLVSITGSVDFSVITFPITPITSTNTTAFQIKFNPSSIGIKTATVSIASNDSDENPYIFEIKGSGNQVFFDSDADSIYDNVDNDDDNDGIPDVTEETNCNSSNGHKVNHKFLNETFGSGPRTTINTTNNANTTYCYEDGTAGINTITCPTLSSYSLDDGEYTIGPSAQIASWAASSWYMGRDHTGDLNGRMAIFNASYSPGVFYTATMTGVLPNVPITYSFWVINLIPTNHPNVGSVLKPNVRVEFRDINNNLLTAINTGAIAPTTTGNLTGDWHQFTADLNFNVTSFKVIFINNVTGGYGNDLALDDILITQRLCDLDNDGVADVFDLDSDNDGIPEIVEAGLGHLSNGKGRMDVTCIDVNGNGLHDSAEFPMNLVLDSDGDGFPNYIDLDSDNDSVFDVDESGAGNSNAASGFVNGDGDINGDGIGDSLDTETFRNKDTNGDGVNEGFGDGILDIFDYGIDNYGNSDQGTINAPFLNYLLDTDGDGIADYIDITSNGVSLDISNTLYASLDGNNDGIIDSTTDIDKDGILDTFDTDTAYFGSPRNLERKLFIEFDGRNDYGQDLSVINGWPNATLMAWINLNNLFSSEGIIVAQDKLQLKVNGARKLQAIANGITITAPKALNAGQWIHTAVVYDSGNSLLKLYINGTMVKSTAISGTLTADASLLTIGKNPSANDKFFKGNIDEIRVFDMALTDAQLQKMVYQEIQDNNGLIKGTIIPKDIASLPWSNLKRYYKMDNFKNNVIDDHTTTTTDVTTGTKIFNVKNIKVQQAPMPFVTKQTGSVASAVNSTINQIIGQDAVDNSCAIIIVNHNITSNTNLTCLGMIINSSKNLEISNDSKLQNDWYLKLDGKIDLQGRSQLVQTTDSDLDPTSSGSVERDQQGQSSLYNYNYWSSPVGPINAVTNNNNYSVGNVFKDGTNPASPININWVGGYDGSPGSPISLARHWIFKFQNVSNAYSNWSQIFETGALTPAQGFTLKGSGATSATQNYTFIGKPFNGTITSPIAANNINLSGNPYASAIDANQFIDDNISSLAGVSATTGTIYFWEHSSLNNTHNLAGYQGGYAAYTKTGGTPPVAPPEINGLGGNTKIAKRFIPVGQAFFVAGSATGGNIIFNNTQRLFVKEDHASSFQLFKTNSNKLTMVTSLENNNNDVYEEDTFSKIRLGFNSNNNYHRQLLLGFMNENATSGYDIGYDGIHIDNQPNDMCFMNGTTKLTIQGDGFFNKNNSYPLEIKTAVQGNVQFVLDSLENFDTNQKIYIHDKQTNIYHNIREQVFEISLPAGIADNRFYLCFKNKKNNDHNDKTSLDEDDLSEGQGIKVMYTHSNEELNITNFSDNKVSAVSLFNIVGQFISKWDITNKEQTNIQIPIQNINSGTYIVKIKTTEGDISKKIIIK